MTERFAMNKPSRAFAKPLRELVGKVVGEAFMRQGFASAELVTRWSEIVGTEIAAHSGPAAIEIQHLGAVICERVNRFFGWRAVERLAFRQSPLRRSAEQPRRRNDGSAALQLAATMPEIADEELRQALGRLLAGLKNG
jgi:hypothetical protein